jgi:THO complex subunit 4
MSSALDMSLEDIIKNTKSSEPRNNNRSSRGGPRGARSSGSGPTRNGRQGRDNRPYQAGVQQYRATPVAPLHTSVIRQSIPDGSKMQVSNLDYRVSAEDLKVN